MSPDARQTHGRSQEPRCEGTFLVFYGGLLCEVGAKADLQTHPEFCQKKEGGGKGVFRENSSKKNGGGCKVEEIRSWDQASAKRKTIQRWVYKGKDWDRKTPG